MKLGGRAGTSLIVLAVGLALGAGPSMAQVDEPLLVTRIGGADRYETAAALSAVTFPAEVPRVLIATGENFPDALAASAVAGRDGGPVLLVKRTSLPPPTRQELLRLEPGASATPMIGEPTLPVMELGGPDAISFPVTRRIGEVTGGVGAFAGADRFDTAALLAGSAYADGAPVVFVATGDQFPDALTAAAAAGTAGGPLLLTRDALPNLTARMIQDDLRPGQIIVVGGDRVVSQAVMDDLARLTEGQVTRLSDGDRYGTAVVVSQATHPAGTDVLYIASGENFPDAMTAGAAAVHRDGGLLLVPGQGPVPAVVLQEVARLAPAEVVVVGGPAAVSDGVVTQVVDAATGEVPSRGGPVVLWETPSGTFRTDGHSEMDIERIREAMEAGEWAGIPNGRMVRGDGGVNVGHDWHLVEIELVDASIELCDGTADYVDEHLDEWMEQVVRYCPWSAFPIAIEDPARL